MVLEPTGGPLEESGVRGERRGTGASPMENIVSGSKKRGLGLNGLSPAQTFESGSNV